MNCTQAANVLRGLETNQLVVTTDEIEELLALGLAIEGDPEHLQLLNWLQPVVKEHAGCDVDSPMANAALLETLKKTEEELKGDWYRMKTSKEVLHAREATRVDMRRALSILDDPSEKDAMLKLMANARLLAPGVQYVCCPQLGYEYYALTSKGWSVRKQLDVRLDRFAEVPFKTFMASFDKVQAKMRAFGGEVTTLANNIGYVKKNKESVVIGLAKTGMPAAQALNAYQAGMVATNRAPDVAVTCARNAAAFGSPAHAAQRLGQAQAAMRQAGFPATPIVMGCAKSLLAFDPPTAGAPRFVDIYRRLEGQMGHGETNFKFAARLMPAQGTPDDVVRRTLIAGQHLNQLPTRTQARSDLRAAAVALASMVREDNQLQALVARFRDIEFELGNSGVSSPATVEADALECVACPGTPHEVIATVSSLAQQIAAGRAVARGDVAVAVAFAKRFAF